MMTSAQVVKTSVTITENSPSQDYTHPDDQTTLFIFILAPAAVWPFSVVTYGVHVTGMVSVCPLVQIYKILTYLDYWSVESMKFIVDILPPTRD